MELLKFFRSQKWEIVGLLLILFSVYVNAFPQGHIILGGDIVQTIRLTENFTELYYDDLGRDSLFYGLFYLLDSVHISDTAQLSWYLGIFLVGSYLSFLAFCACVVPGASKIARVVMAVFYAANLYTLYIFTATWGYSSYQIVYIFIPVLSGLYIRFLETRKDTYLIWFFTVVFLASSSFGNPAFALSLGIYFLLLTGLLFLSRMIVWDSQTFLRIALVALGSLLLNIYWILPLIPQMSAGVQSVYTSEVVNLTERLQKTSNAIFDTIRLMPTSEHNRYFPTNFPYPEFSWLKKYFSLLAFAPFFLVLIGFMRKKEEREQRLYGVFFALLAIFIVLVARVRFPFDGINSLLFHLPGLNTLRGYDKFATFTPFLLSVLLLLFLTVEEKKRYAKIVISGVFAAVVLLALPFYTGGIQTHLSYILSGQKNKDFTQAKQSALVEIPQDYYDVMPLLAADRGDYKLAMLPFSPGSSIGRVNLPPRKVNGPHVARYLYDQQFVELTVPYVSGWKFAEDFENPKYDPSWITDLYGLIGVKYILYHKDAKQSSINDLEVSRQYLERIGAIKLLLNNESLLLYRIDTERVLPYLYTTSELSFLQIDPEGLSQSLVLFRKTVSPLEYKKKNPKEMVVTVDSLRDGAHVFLNEKPDALWIAEYVAPNGTRTKLARDANIRFANVWKIEKDLTGGTVLVYYSPIRLLYVGEWVTGLSLLGLFFWGIFRMRKNHNV